MIRTSQDILNILYQTVKASAWVAGSSKIDGGVYFDELRPRDSRKEDAVLIHTAGEVGQVQTGVVTILLYVPDIRPFANGVGAPNLSRLNTLGGLVQTWLHSLSPIHTGTDDIQFYQNGKPIAITYDEDAGQHFLSIRINYRILTL